MDYEEWKPKVVYPEVMEAVLSSRKYAHLYQPLMKRVCEEEIPKYKNDRDRIKAIKNRLHVMYGAFVDETAHKKAEALMNASDTVDILRLHASTRERIPYLYEFYAFIFDTVGQVTSILDIGCGFNPFTLPWMPTENLQAYYAYDIDTRTTTLLNRYFLGRGLPPYAHSGDLAVETPTESVEVAFMFKLIPVLNGQFRDRGFQLLREVRAKYIVATYPVQTLCGKNKGMGAHYAEAFENAMKSNFSEGCLLDKATIGNELVYILRLQPVSFA